MADWDGMIRAAWLIVGAMIAGGFALGVLIGWLVRGWCIKRYLDSCIRYWREPPHINDSVTPKMAQVYVDAFQSARLSLFGVLLLREERPDHIGPWGDGFPGCLLVLPSLMWAILQRYWTDAMRHVHALLSEMWGNAGEMGEPENYGWGEDEPTK